MSLYKEPKYHKDSHPVEWAAQSSCGASILRVKTQLEKAVSN